MKFKIQNENKMWQLYSFASILLIFPAMMIQNAFAICIVFIILAAVVISNILNNTVKTKIEVEDGIMSVRHVIGTRQINIDDIEDLSFEHYSQMRKRNKYTHFRDYRVELTIYANGKLLKYTDRACTIGKPKSFFSSEYESVSIPDDEIQLYQLYCHLREVTGL